MATTASKLLLSIRQDPHDGYSRWAHRDRGFASSRETSGTNCSMMLLPHIAEQIEQFLDWSRYPEWAGAHIKSIEVASRKEEGTIQAGDKLKVALKGMTFSPVVLVRILRVHRRCMLAIADSLTRRTRNKCSVGEERFRSVF